MVWFIFYAIDLCLTEKKFRNYVASELYTVEEGMKKKMTMKRGPLPYGFNNEITPADGRPLNLGRVNFLSTVFCVCCKTRSMKVFSRARDLSTQELNIASIVKSQRESKAAVGLLKASMG